MDIQFFDLRDFKNLKNNADVWDIRIQFCELNEF